jgi:hypothetical protein
MYQSSTAKNYVQAPVYKKLYQISLLLALAAIIGVPIFTHSIHNVWYAAMALYLLIGGHYLSQGVTGLHRARQSGLSISWYTQYPLTLGLACLVLALTLCIEFGLVNNLPGSVSDLVGNITWIVLGCLFFVLLMLGLHYSRSTATQRFGRSWKGFK